MEQERFAGMAAGDRARAQAFFGADPVELVAQVVRGVNGEVMDAIDAVETTAGDRLRGTGNSVRGPRPGCCSPLLTFWQNAVV